MKTIWDELRGEGYRLSGIKGWVDLESRPPVRHLWRRIGVLSDEEEVVSILSKLEGHLVIGRWDLVFRTSNTLVLDVHWTEELHRDNVHAIVSGMPESERIGYIARRME